MYAILPPMLAYIYHTWILWDYDSWWPICIDFCGVMVHGLRSQGPQYPLCDGGSIDRRPQLFPQRLSRSGSLGPLIEWGKPHGKKLRGPERPSGCILRTSIIVWFQTSISPDFYLSICHLCMVTFITWCWKIRWQTPTVRTPWESAFFAHVPSTWKDGKNMEKPS